MSFQGRCKMGPVVESWDSRLVEVVLVHWKPEEGGYHMAVGSVGSLAVFVVWTDWGLDSTQGELQTHLQPQKREEWRARKRTYLLSIHIDMSFRDILPYHRD
jgi:hypothetical protein